MAPNLDAQVFDGSNSCDVNVDGEDTNFYVHILIFGMSQQSQYMSQILQGHQQSHCSLRTPLLRFSNQQQVMRPQTTGL